MKNLSLILLFVFISFNASAQLIATVELDKPVYFTGNTKKKRLLKAASF